VQLPTCSQWCKLRQTAVKYVYDHLARVSFFLNRFRDLGFIDYNGGGRHIHSSVATQPNFFARTRFRHIRT
jgi:hypothetical protein